MNIKKRKKKRNKTLLKEEKKTYCLHRKKMKKKMAGVFLFFGIGGKIAKRKTQETSCRVVVNYYCYLVVFDVIL